MTTFSEFLADQHGYRRIFVGAYGPWPHDCAFCDGEVDGHTVPFDSTAAVVHHLDHDHENDAPENLAPAHHGCHTTYHHTGAKRPPETGQRITDALTGRTLSPEYRAAMSAARVGKPKSPETRARMSAARKGRSIKPHTPEARARMSAARKGIPKTSEHRANIREANLAQPHASCVKCRRECTAGGALTGHLRACYGGKP